MAGEPISLSIADGVARITLDSPKTRNAVTARSSAGFLDAVEQATSDASVRVIVLKGTGDFFCVGGDIDEFVSNEHDLPGHVKLIADNIHGGIRCLVDARAPVVVGLNGIAAGGGVGMALTGDVIVARRSAKINSGYTRSGLTPDAGLTWFLPRLVGHVRAFEIIAFNEFVSAEKACELGLITTVVEDSSFDDEIEALVQRLKTMPGTVMGDAKRLLRRAALASLDVQLDNEAQAIADRVQTPETVSVLRKFAKR